MSDSLSIALSRERNEYIDKNTFCYTIRGKGTDAIGKYHDMMIDDLNRFFKERYGLVGELISQKMKCKVLTVTSSAQKFKSAGGVEELRSYKPQSYSIKNMPVASFLETLSNTYFKDSREPFLNETNYSGNVDIALTGDLSDLENLNRQLANYGLTLLEKEKEIKMIIIKQVDKK